MNNKLRKQILCLFLALILILTGCSGGVLETLDKGASNYAENSEGQNLQSSNVLDTINFLLDHYTSGLATGQQKKIPEEEYKKKHGPGKKDPSGSTGNPSGNTGTPSGGSQTAQSELVDTFEEYYDAIHEQLIATEEDVEVRIDAAKAAEIVNKEKDILNKIYVEDMQGFIAWENAEIATIQGTKEWTVRIHINYSLDVDEIKRMKKEVKRELQEVYDKLDLDHLSDIDRVNAINKYLCNTIEYPAKEPYTPQSHTIYGALIDGSAVCEGYAKAAQALMEMAGMQSYYVTGVCTNGVGHGWNLVRIDGTWYQWDPTWNDGYGKPYDSYLLVTDNFMKKSRTWDTSKFPATGNKSYY